MQKLHLVGFTTDLDGLILASRKGAKSGSFVVPLDDRLVRTVDEALKLRDEQDPGGPPHAQLEALRPPRPQSALSVKEVQERLRGGQSVEAVAKAAGVDAAWVDRFAAPIQAEQARVVERARRMVYDKPRFGESRLPLGESVARNVAQRGVRLSEDELAEAWGAYQVHDTLWAVRFTYVSRGRPQEAEWLLDLETETLTSDNRLAAQLGHVARRGGARAAGRGPARKAPPGKSTAKKGAARKGAARKGAARKGAAKKSRAAGKKAASKRTAAKKRAAAPARRQSSKGRAPSRKRPAEASARRAPAKGQARKAAARKAAARKAVPRKATAKTAPAKTAPARKAARRSSKRNPAKRPSAGGSGDRSPAAQPPLRPVSPARPAAEARAWRPEPRAPAPTQPAPPAPAPPAPRVTVVRPEQRPVPRPAAAAPGPSVLLPVSASGSTEPRNGTGAAADRTGDAAPDRRSGDAAPEPRAAVFRIGAVRRAGASEEPGVPGQPAPPARPKPARRFRRRERPLRAR